MPDSSLTTYDRYTVLNRKLAPPVQEIHNLTLPHPEVVQLDNGLKVYVLDFPGQAVLKVEAVFHAGRPEESVRLASRATARLMREGTRTRTGGEIAEHFDFYGASLSVPTSLDTANFSLFALKKYAAELIPVFAEVLQHPSFPEEELETFRRNSMQELQVDLEKVDVLAYRKITEVIFGERHPYGYNSFPEDYAALTRDHVVAYFEQWYTPSNCMLFASGGVDAAVIALLNQHFGQQPMIGQKTDYQNNINADKPKKIHIPHPASLQTAIRVGRRLFDKKHPDFRAFFILNTILGGYFGSRLMTNIREKKGYTYNIYSTVDAMLYDSCFYIATEVNTDNAAATLRAIYAEMKRLREKPVDASEIEMVRNYLLGMMLNGLDGPMNISEVVRGLIVEEMSWSSFDALIETIRTITPEQLQEMAVRYLQPADFWTVTVG